jgi:hypothetical protein
MSLRDLSALYLLVGLPLGVLAYRRGGRFPVVSLLGTMLLWPLWAPFSVLAAAPVKAPGAEKRACSAAVERAIAEVEEAARGSALSPALIGEVRAAATRLDHRRADLETAITESRARLAAAARDQGPGAEVQRRALPRLVELRDEAAAALDGLLGLISALSASLLLSRFEAPGGDDLEALVAALHAHLELLGPEVVQHAVRPGIR